MSQSNGVIRVGRKGLKKFAFGEEGEPFQVDVVEAFQAWIGIDDSFRDEKRELPTASMQEYHRSAVDYVRGLSGCGDITIAEALDFIARLREAYDEVADFFQPRSKTKLSSVESLEARFSHSEV